MITAVLDDFEQSTVQAEDVFDLDLQIEAGPVVAPDAAITGTCICSILKTNCTC
ncbi:FDLD family class I lanthipeptide [Streptomyces sp. NPDC050095]|uniref:FDLD family class I lanthipeptide n=1 Tax=unclassified Streptomyces TaxID=2593676 RepID=UPI00343BA4BC